MPIKDDDGRPNRSRKRRQQATTNVPVVETNGFTIIFLEMALGLWAKDFPEPTIQGVAKGEALGMAGQILDRNFNETQIAEAFEAIADFGKRMRAERLNATQTATQSTATPTVRRF